MKRGKHSFHILKALFSSDTRQSMKCQITTDTPFGRISDVSYSDECRTKKVLSVCEKNVSAFSCNSEILQYQQIIHKLITTLTLCNLALPNSALCLYKTQEYPSLSLHIGHSLTDAQIPMGACLTPQNKSAITYTMN